MSSAWERFTDQKKHQKNHSSGQTTMKKEIHEIGPEYIFMIYSNHTKRWERESERKCGIEAPRNSGRKSNVNEPNERVHSWTARTEIAAFNFFLSCIGADFQMLNSDPKEETKQQNQKKNTQKIAKPIL